jgi:hypothetical protein
VGAAQPRAGGRPIVLARRVLVRALRPPRLVRALRPRRRLSRRLSRRLARSSSSFFARGSTFIARPRTSSTFIARPRTSTTFLARLRAGHLARLAHPHLAHAPSSLLPSTAADGPSSSSPRSRGPPSRAAHLHLPTATHLHPQHPPRGAGNSANAK